MGDENRMSADQVLQGLGGRGVVVDLGEPEYLVLSQGEKTISVLMEPLDDDVLESIMERAEKVQSGDLKAHAGLVTDLLHDVLDLESISDDEREMILGAGIVAKYRIVGAVQEYLCQGVEDAVRKNPSVARARRGQGRRG